MEVDNPLLVEENNQSSKGPLSISMIAGGGVLDGNGKLGFLKFMGRPPPRRPAHSESAFPHLAVDDCTKGWVDPTRHGG